MPDHTAYIGLGANLGDAPAALRAAIQALAALPGTQLLQCSALYRSAPVDATGPDFYNAVAALRTSLPPQELLAALQSIEAAAGRERPYRNAPRTLDLDILLFDAWAIDTPTLTVPHPRMHERAFVLLPLAEIAPAQVRAEWLQAVRDQRIERLGAV
ncbi:2-amino-4-hydroxy-6-hydroxymethyldihydropteridine diphosphokinase [Acidovorax sp.]|uniref:2-amino-4-hydroxy-6- hydroxymethyldihydropteridine diphosphokinase n=1 Tax=Acidovorax sp. TaxID=1872122 RepID=UPI0025C29F55|nr:2-amino-4-hydroxy-6-hydroxymethyldihydropteridine diphosphokinase [Acidovorax sp.]MCI5069480.1 2-amino-4-hydroxy-6-hydroxymethyldihydropteridine diphosphokinase [Acidovorax sp.]